MRRANRLVGCAAFLAAAFMLFVPLTALAEQRPTPPDLPPTELARESIDQDPGVKEARRALVAAGHGAAALRAGSNEWTTKVAAQRRRYDNGGNSNEWTASLERTIRIGGKAGIDTQLGESELLISQARIGEARREAARALADLWLDTLTTSRQRELWAEQLSFAETSHQAVEKRRKAGDASMLDLNVARADLIEVQRQLRAATSAEAKAKAKLAVRFPTLKYEPKPLAEPTALDLSLPQWRDRILSESDPIKIAEGLLRKAELSAARAKADRIPDPTVGVYAASEAFRNERIVGLSLSIPLSGNYRSERMYQALQEAEAARAKVERQKRDEETEVVEAYADAIGGLERWRLASQGLSTTRDSARMTQRAYTLGEADLQTLLLARRQALDASTATEQARVEALRWHYRLLVDAHLIWALEED
ncbi:MAG: TolC family protein [Burkholderiales bacterium]|nr:TolC family protein [Burkholderiales bacterium]